MRVPTNRVGLHAECFLRNRIAGQLRRIVHPLVPTDDLCQISVRRRPSLMVGDVSLRLQPYTNTNNLESL